MKKALFALIPAFLFASCKFWNEPIEEFFSYWSAEAYVTGSDVKVPAQRDSSGVTSIASGADADILLSASNPKSFRFIMPTAGNSEMIKFTGLSAQPVPGTDYSLTQVSSDTLKLTYKSAFLKTHEWGTADLGTELTLYADDGRKFVKPYVFNLKANTPPPTPTFVLAKTTSSGKYVLCLQVPDMNVSCSGGTLHQDIAKISIDGTEYDLKVNGTKEDFVKPDSAKFIGNTAVEQLTGSPALPSGKWILYYETEVPVGGAYHEYQVFLTDEMGLVSGTIKAGTATNEPPAEIVTVTAGELGTGSGNSDMDPFVIKVAASAPEARLEIKNVAGTTVHCTVTEVVGTAAPARYDGNPVTFPLGLDSKNEKTYKVEYYTDGTGFKRSQDKTKYYKVAKSYTITFSVDGQGGSLTGTYNGNAHRASGSTVCTVRAAAGETITFSTTASADYAVHCWTGVRVSPPTGTTATLTVTGDATVTVKFYETTFDGSSHSAEAWKKLKELIAAAPAGGTLKISGTIKATTAPGNSGEIIIDKDLTIEAKTGTATLDANESAFTDKKDKHRIFHVKDGKTLTLKKLTLTKGAVGNKAAAGGYGTRGGGILLKSGTVSLSDVTLSGCKAITDSGEGGLHGNGAGIYVVSGNIIMENTTLSANIADAYGGGVYLSGSSALIMKGSNTITGCSAGSGGAICASGATVNITNCTITRNSTRGEGGALYAVKNGSTPANVTISGGVIGGTTAADANKATGTNGEGGGIYIDEGCSLTLKDGAKVIGNSAKNGGGIYVKGAGATLTMSGGKISANKAVVDGTNGGAGGGIFIYTGAKLTISGSTVVGGSSDAEGNSAAVGGGIYMMDNGAEAEMTGGSITHNKADKSGGGVYISDYNSNSRSLFTLKDGTISYNTAKNGGGITAFGDFNMDGGIIEKNTATGDNDASLNLGTGGGIDLVAATMNMTGGEIKENHAKRGGGVSIGLSGARDAVFNMSGGTISGNTLDPAGKGAGVEFFTESTEHGGIHYYTRMKMSGSAKVDTDNDVYLNDSRMITVDGELTGTAPVACITPKNYSAGLRVLEAGTGVNLASEAGKFTVTSQPSPIKKWTIDEQGQLQEITGGSASSATAKWTALKNAVEANTTPDAVFYIEGEYTMSSGTDTIASAVSYTIRGTNNAVLNGDSKGTMINIGYSRNITLENLKIQNGKNDSFALSASFGSEVYLKNVTVSNTKKIVKSNSGDVTFENVEALDTDSAIELGGGNSGSGEVEYSYLKIKGDTNFKGTVKLNFPYNGNDYSSAVKICDKKSYTLKLDFDGYYDKAENQQVVFLDPSVTGFTLADAVKNITVKDNGSSQWYIDDNGYLKKR